MRSKYDERKKALSYAASLWCCWILFEQKDEVVKEVKRGGMGMSFPSIRRHMQTLAKLEPREKGSDK